jgi:hypothetical protein
VPVRIVADAGCREIVGASVTVTTALALLTEAPSWLTTT